jgi:hypothetical protein
MSQDDGSSSSSDEDVPAALASASAAEGAAALPGALVVEPDDEGDEGFPSPRSYRISDLIRFSLGEDDAYTHCTHLATPEGFAAEEFHICQCRCDPEADEYKQRYPIRWLNLL